MNDLARTAVSGEFGLRRGVRRWSLSIVLLACLVSTTLHYASRAGATAHGAATSCVTATRAKPVTPLTSFPANALPAGTATGVPSYYSFSAGYTLKHTHGGPTYVYVISGDIQITDNNGSVTYCAGSFFSEPPGHVHTLHVIDPSEIFVLQFLPPGADSTIPVQ